MQLLVEVSKYPSRIRNKVKFNRLNSGKILDIGCGDGTFSCVLKEFFRVKETYGRDQSIANEAFYQS